MQKVQRRRRSDACLTSASRSWAIDKKGCLEERRSREKAHKDRVTALLTHNGFLYSVSYDGSVKMWDADSMELVMEAANAHEGGRVNCAAIGPDGNLYTGGDDKVRTAGCGSVLGDFFLRLSAVEEDAFIS